MIGKTENSVTNRFLLARSAYQRRDVEFVNAAHAHEHLEHALREDGARGQHFADTILGATDGIITTFAVVAGAAGAQLSPGIVLIMGFANPKSLKPLYGEVYGDCENEMEAAFPPEAA